MELISGGYEDRWNKATLEIKKESSPKDEHDWWELFSAYDPRKAMNSVKIGDIVFDREKSGVVLEAFVMPWRDGTKYGQWKKEVLDRYNVSNFDMLCLSKIDIISDIHYGGFVIEKKKKG